MSIQHSIEGVPAAEAIGEEDWPAFSAGFEAGLAEGIRLARVRVSVELAAMGPATAGVKLWRAVTDARLTTGPEHTGSTATGEQLREQAHRSWGLPYPQQDAEDHQDAEQQPGLGRRPSRVRVVGDLFHGRIPAGAVYVGRGAPGLPGSRYANRHHVGACRTCGRQHDQAGAVAAFARDLTANPDQVEAVRRDLTGRDLACWCRTDGRPCHGDVLIDIANPAPTSTVGGVR